MSELLDLYGVNENTKKVAYNDVHVKMPIEQVHELMIDHTLTWFPEDPGYYYLLPKEKDNGHY